MKNLQKYTPVKTHKAWLTYLMFETAKKRIKDKAWSYSKNLGGKNVAVAFATETITGADIFCLIAIVKFIFDNQEKVVASVINYPETKDAPAYSEVVLSIATTLNFFLTHYMNHKNKEELINTLKRLRSYQVSYDFYEMKGKKETHNSHTEHYLRSCPITGENVIFTVSEALYKVIDTDGWTINFSRLSELTGIAQALYMYLSQQGGTVFTQAFLEQRLDLVEADYKNRDAIKQALTLLLPRKDSDPPEAKRIGYLKSFKVIKKGKGTYSFQIERNYSSKKETTK